MVVLLVHSIGEFRAFHWAIVMVLSTNTLPMKMQFQNTNKWLKEQENTSFTFLIHTAHLFNFIAV